jgi:hypothetical protein
MTIAVRDAFVLALFGCQVTVVERNRVIAALVRDAFDRAKAENLVRRLLYHHFLSKRSQDGSLSLSLS